MMSNPKLEQTMDSLLQFYKNEANRCGNQRAYLAGCVCLGSAVETGLLWMALLYPKEVMRSQTYQRKKKRHSILEWTLFDLLRLGRELDWIPTKLQLDETLRTSGLNPEDALRRGDLAFFADFLREIRDLVHPGRYIRKWKGARITKNYYEFCWTIAELVFDWLGHKAGGDAVREAEELEQTKSRVRK